MFSSVLLLISAVLVSFDIRTYKQRRQAAETDDARQAAWVRFRRRVQASSGIGLVGVLSLIGVLIDAKAHPLATACVWMAAILVTFWIVLIALLDLMSTRQQLAELKHQQVIQTAILQSELKRAQEKLRAANETQVNGKPGSHRSSDDDEIHEDDLSSDDLYDDDL